MDLEDYVISLELAKRLKTMGIKQESLFYWFRFGNSLTGPKIKYFYNIEHGGKSFLTDNLYQSYSAFTVSELGEMLPSEITFNDIKKELIIYKDYDNKWDVVYRNNNSYYPIFVHSNLACAMAGILIHLIENKFMEAP